MRRILLILLYAVMGIAALLAAARSFFNQPLPAGAQTPQVEAMTEAVYTALNKPAWDSTRWVQWRYRDGRLYVWDKVAGRVHVTWSKYDVWLYLSSQKNAVLEDGVALTGPDADKVAQKALARFYNDSFWLIAPYKLTDPGTVRSEVTLPDGRKGLKVTYGSGGVTPGDTYVWELDAQGVPTKFRMWVAILPVGGLPATWEDWVTLPTGAKIARKHRIGGAFDLTVTDVNGGQGPPSW